MPKPENVKPHEFKKGKSGNPNGRPPGKSLTTLLKERLEGEAYEIINDAMIVLENGKLGGTVKVRVKRPMMVKLINAAAKHAANGNAAYFKEIYNRTEGKVEQPIRQINDIDIDITYEDFHSE